MIKILLIFLICIQLLALYSYERWVNRPISDDELIQYGIDRAIETNGTVYLPPGTYQLSKPLMIGKPRDKKKSRKELAQEEFQRRGFKVW